MNASPAPDGSLDLLLELSLSLDAIFENLIDTSVIFSCKKGLDITVRMCSLYVNVTILRDQRSLPDDLMMSFSVRLGKIEEDIF